MTSNNIENNKDNNKAPHESDPLISSTLNSSSTNTNNNGATTSAPIPSITQFESSDNNADAVPPPPSRAAAAAAAGAGHRRTNSRGGGNHHRRVSSTMSQVLGTIIEDFPHHVTEGLQEAAELAQETIQDVTVAVQDAAESMQENVVEEITDIKDTFLEELHEADTSDNFFLEMALTRNLSILPSDMEQVAFNTAPEDSNIQDPQAGHGASSSSLFLTDDPEKQRLTAADASESGATTAPPYSAYFLLASAVISLSSIGPLLQFQKDVLHPTIKIVWRQFATSLVLLPFAIHECCFHRNRKTTTDALRQMTFPQWTTFFLAAVCYVTMCVSFVLALQYTSVGNAVILSNSQSMLLLVGKICVGSKLAWQEGTGAVIAFVGAILCSIDSSKTGSSEGGEAAAAAAAADGALASSSHMGLFGDFLGVLSAVGGVGYLTFAKTARSNMSLFVFMYLVMFTGSILNTLFMKFVLRLPVTLDRNDHHGVFGWMTIETDRLPLELVMVLICNMFGSLGYVRAMQYFDNLVITVAALMEPLIAEFLAFFIGVAILPGLEGWVGNVLVIIGTLLVIVGGSSGGGKKSSMGH